MAGHIEATSMGVPQGGPLSPVLPLPEGVAIVLGELCATIVAQIAPGELCVVIGWPLGVEGRKRLAGSAVYAASGRLVAKARAVWIEVPLNTWN